jgi:hypothetical protein
MAVAVEKLGFPENWIKTDDQKCIRIRRKSFIANPRATIFLRDLRERVFQQPQPLPLTILHLPFFYSAIFSTAIPLSHSAA